MTVLFTFSASAIAAAPAAPIELPAAAQRAPVSSTKATPLTDPPHYAGRSCASRAMRTIQFNRRDRLVHLQRLRDRRRARVADRVACRRAPRARER